MAVLPAAFSNCRRIDDGHHLTDVFVQQTVKECLVAILQRRQKHIAFDIAVFSLVVFVGASELFLDSGTMHWKQSRKAKLASLIFGKGAALIQQRVVQQKLSGEIGFYYSFASTRHNRTHCTLLRLEAAFYIAAQ